MSTSTMPIPAIPNKKLGCTKRNGCPQDQHQAEVTITNRSDIAYHKQGSENIDWVKSLRGQLGVEVQQRAHNELTRYLSSVIQYYLIHRQPDLLWLASLDRKEIVKLSEDLVQICWIKLSRNNHVKLCQYSGAGTFKGWASQIALNTARSELRRVRWDRRLPLESIQFLALDEAPSPEAALQQSQLCSALQHCLSQLPEDYRVVLVRCIMNGEPAGDVARDLQRTNQAIYNLINRAKKQLRELLSQRQIHVEDLSIFSS